MLFVLSFKKSERRILLSKPKESCVRVIGNWSLLLIYANAPGLLYSLTPILFGSEDLVVQQSIVRKSDLKNGQGKEGGALKERGGEASEQNCRRQNIWCKLTSIKFPSTPH